MPTVSVILPFYQAERTLQTALNSISGQTFNDFECLMINNNSTDKSIRIAEKHAEKDHRFRLLHEKQQGVAYASACGSRHSAAPIIARMDADDIAFRNRLELQVAYLKNHPGIDAVTGKVKFGGDPVKAAGFKRYVDWNNSITTTTQIRLKRFIELPLVNPTAMWRKSAEVQAGGYRYGNFPEDYELWLRWIDKGLKIAKTGDYVLQWNDPPNRLTRTDRRYSSNAFYKIKTHYLARELQRINSQNPHVVVCGSSRIIRRRANKLKEHNIIIDAWLDIRENHDLAEKVINYDDLPEPGKIFILIYVSQPQIQSQIVNYLQAKNYVEGVHFLLVA